MELDLKRGTTSLWMTVFFFRKQLVIGNCNFLDTTWHRTKWRPTRRQVWNILGVPWTYSLPLFKSIHINMIVPLQSVPIPVQSGVQWTGRWIFVYRSIYHTACCSGTTTNCNARYAIHFQTWMVVQPVTINHDMFFTVQKGNSPYLCCYKYDFWLCYLTNIGIQIG